MPGLTLKQVYAALKRGRVEPVYYLTGSEEMLKDEVVAAIVDHVVDPATRDFNLDVRSAGDLDGETLHALVETPPMLAERRVVVVRNVNQWRRNAKVWNVLLKYLKRPSPATVLVLTHAGEHDADKRVVAASTVVVLDHVEPDLLRRWLARRAKDANVGIDDDALEHLADVVGGNLAVLAGEIDKLAAALPADRPATVDDVSRLVGVRRGETVQDWLEALAQRDVTRCVSLVDVMLAHSGLSAVQLVTQAGTALIGIRLARALLDAGSPPRKVETQVLSAIRAARLFTVPNWGRTAGTWTRAAAAWTPAQLDAAIADAYAADRRLKSTGIADAGGVLRGFVLRTAPRAAAA